MKLRSPLMLVLFVFFALSAVAASAQGGLYLNPVFTRASNSTSDQGTFSFLGPNTTSRFFGGVSIGGEFDFKSSYKLAGGIDLRDMVVHSNGALLNTFAFGPRIIFQAHPDSPWRPYLEPFLGAATSRSPNTEIHITKVELGGFAGVDYRFHKHIDFRAFEIGYSTASTSSDGTIGGTATVPNVEAFEFEQRPGLPLSMSLAKPRRTTPRIAFFGGTFDPPHRGHITIARAAADAFALTSVLFAPAGVQPLKLGHTGSSFAERMAMVAQACQADRRFAVSDVDAPRADGKPNYTADALGAVANANPGAILFNLVGADSFRDLGRWRQPAELLQLAEWIVVSRPGYTLADPKNFPLTSAQRARVHLLNAVHLDIAATALRSRLAEGERCEDLLTPAVATYIQTHGLYRKV